MLVGTRTAHGAVDHDVDQQPHANTAQRGVAQLAHQGATRVVRGQQVILHVEAVRGELRHCDAGDEELGP